MTVDAKDSLTLYAPCSWLMVDCEHYRLRNHAGLRAVAQLPRLARLSLAGCRSDSVRRSSCMLSAVTSGTVAVGKLQIADCNSAARFRTTTACLALLPGATPTTSAGPIGVHPDPPEPRRPAPLGGPAGHIQRRDPHGSEAADSVRPCVRRFAELCSSTYHLHGHVDIVSWQCLSGAGYTHSPLA
jgi:hypothetical protein